MDALHSLLHSLAALHSLDSDRRSQDPTPRAHGSSPDPDAARVGQVASGAIGRARVVSARLAAVSPRERATLLALAEGAHALRSDPTTVARWLAVRVHRDVALEERAARASARSHVARVAADQARSLASTLARWHGRLSPIATEALRRQEGADARAAEAHGLLEGAEAEITARGLALLEDALRAWQSAST